MHKNEIIYRLQAMATMCTFQDAVGHYLSHKEIKLYNEAKDEAIKAVKKLEKIRKVIDDDMICNSDAFVEIGKILDN